MTEQQTITDWADLREAARTAGFKRLHRRGTRAFPGSSTYFRIGADGYSHMDTDGSVSVDRDFLVPGRRLRIDLYGPAAHELLVAPTPAEVFTAAQRLGIGGAW